MNICINTLHKGDNDDDDNNNNNNKLITFFTSFFTWDYVPIYPHLYTLVYSLIYLISLLSKGFKRSFLDGKESRNIEVTIHFHALLLLR